MNDWVHLFALELAVAALGTTVLLADAAWPLRTRALGYLTGAGLLSILAASFVIDGAGEAPFGAYEGSAWSLYFKRVLVSAAFLGVLGAVDWLHDATPRRQAEYYALMLYSLCGMMALPGARDWVLFVVAFELMGIPLVALAAWAKHDAVNAGAGPKLAAEAALKLFVTSAVSSSVTLFGLALVTGLSGSTSMLAPAPAATSALYTVGLLMVLGGVAFKVGAVPFHFWVPDTYQGAPMPFVAFLSVAPKAAGLAGLAVVLLKSFGAQSSVWVPALGFVAGSSMWVGNMFALPQTDVRRLLGFSGIAQIGYVLLAFLAHSTQSLSMALFFIATYVFTNMGVFFVAHAAATGNMGSDLGTLAGLSRRAPALGAALLVFLLSLAGIPFVAGFWAKLFVFMAAWRAGFAGLVLLGATLAVVGLFYYLSVARSTFMRDGASSESLPVAPPLAWAIGLCLFAVVGLGLWPSPLVEEATRAASALSQTRLP